MKRFMLLIGFILLLGVEILRVYFIMPFPGSQQRNTINFGYWLDQNIVWIRILALAILAYPVWQVFRNSKRWKKFSVFFVFAFYALVFYLFNFRFEADKMFYQPKHKALVLASENKVGLDKLVLGISMNGEAKAYPIQLIGYHHLVQDTVGAVPIIVTYCTVCRSGRIFSPFVNGRPETFRLVGMDHFNAMFEDATTKSWWQQETGAAVAGPLKGAALPELPSKQVTLAVWLRAHPNSSVFQPDSNFSKKYAELNLFDQGTLSSSLERRDSLSWKNKSWIIGIDQNHHSKAYDWNRLAREKLIEDSLPDLPLLITMEKDNINFHVWKRAADGVSLHFMKTTSQDTLMDVNTGSKWNMDGRCVEGKLNGKQLQSVQAYQEFWHSWKNFHPQATKGE